MYPSVHVQKWKSETEEKKRLICRLTPLICSDSGGGELRS